MIRYNVGCTKRLRLFNGLTEPSGSKYIKKRKTPDMKKKWKRQEGRVTTGPIQRVRQLTANLILWAEAQLIG